MERAIWKSRPVFITSTFQDMQAERDYLRNFVFYALEDWLRAKREHLEWIDLRVGVASAKVENETARDVLVLKVCLDEVRRSRPFLIALIGDRYGMPPPKERIEAAAKEAGFLGDIQDRSLTDLEIDFGVFHDKEQRRRSLFFLRAPLPYDRMGPEKAAEYSDEYANDKGAAQRWERLKALKSRIRREFTDRCFDYSVSCDGEGRITGLEAWGLEVENKIKQAIEDELAAAPPAAAEQGADDADRDALADFAEDRARNFIGRVEVLGEIERLLGSPAKEGAPWGLCITGEAGSGKSALFGALYQGLTAVRKEEREHLSKNQRAFQIRLHGLDAFVLAHAAGASSGATSVDGMLRRWIGELAALLDDDFSLAENAGPDEIDATFGSLLGQAALQRRVIVLVDALDQFEQTTRGRFATWLPKLWPANARFVATAIPGDASNELTKRPGIVLKPIPQLNAAEARDIAIAVFTRHHREPEPEVLEALIRDGGETYPRWGKPLWLVLATEELNLLDADDFARAKLLPGRDDERIRALMCQMAAGYPPDVPGLYRDTFDRAAALFGAKLTQAFLGLIAVSRSGWRESDFRSLLPKISGEPWNELHFAQLRRSFRGQLCRRGAMDQWDFAHAQMRIAAREWLVERNGPSEEVLHTAVGDRLLALPADDPLHISETMVHLVLGEQGAERAANYYGNALLTDTEKKGATHILAETILSTVSDNPEAGACRVTRLMPATSNHEILTTLAERFLFDLHDLIAFSASRSALSVLLRSTNDVFLQLTASDPDNLNLKRYLAVSWGRIANVLFAQGEFAESLRAFRESHAIFANLERVQPVYVGGQRDLLDSSAGIGDVLVAQGNLPEALKAFRYCLVIAERLVRAYPGVADCQHDLSYSLERIGGVQAALGSIPQALMSFRDGLAIMERLASGDPKNPRWQRGLSVLWLNIGDMLVAQGNLTEAQKAFRAGHTLRERLAQTDPRNAFLQLDLATSFERIGDVALKQGNLLGAVNAFRDQHAIIERLARADPGNSDWQRSLSISWNKIGDVLVAQFNVLDALEAFKAGLTIAEALASTNPNNQEWQRNVAASWSKIGDALFERGDLPGALKAFRNASVLSELLVTSTPDNLQWQSDLSLSYDRIGEVLFRQRDITGAKKVFQDAFSVRERLARADASNAVYQRHLGVAFQRIGDVALAQSNLSEALKAFRDSLGIAERLVRIDRGNVGWQRDFFVSWMKVGDVLLEQGNLPDALKAFRDSFDIAERLAGIDSGNAGRQRDLLVSWMKIGEVLAIQGNFPEALKSFRDSLGIAERMAGIDPGNAEWQRDLLISLIKFAQASLAGGDRTEARVVAEKAHAIAHARYKKFRGQMNTEVELNVVSDLLRLFEEGAAFATPAPVRQAPAPKPATPSSDAIAMARTALEEGDAARALDILSRDGGNTPACRALLGVCQLRTGNTQGALASFAALLFPNGSRTPSDTVPVRWIANYATAQLMDGDIRGARKTLSLVWDQQNPSIARLQTTIGQWEESLTFRERLKWTMGGTNDKPITLDFPPGEY